MDLTKQGLYNIFIFINYSLTIFYIPTVNNNLDRDTVNISASSLDGTLQNSLFNLNEQMFFSEI